MFLLGEKKDVPGKVEIFNWKKKASVPYCDYCHRISPWGWLDDSFCTRRLLCRTRRSLWRRRRCRCRRWRRADPGGRTRSHLVDTSDERKSQGSDLFRRRLFPSYLPLWRQTGIWGAAASCSRLLTSARFFYQVLHNVCLIYTLIDKRSYAAALWSLHTTSPHIYSFRILKGVSSLTGSSAWRNTLFFRGVVHTCRCFFWTGAAFHLLLSEQLENSSILVLTGSNYWNNEFMASATFPSSC